MTLKKGDSVRWKWGSGHAEGTVEKVIADRMEIQTKGSKITRDGTQENPAIVITDSSGSKVLKLASEL